MLPETTATTGRIGIARTPRTRVARLVEAISVISFLAAATAMVVAGALHSAGQAGTSSMLATLGYALGVAGITAGVLALALESPADPTTLQETP
jgi:hypothetical protein